MRNEDFVKKKIFKFCFHLFSFVKLGVQIKFVEKSKTEAKKPNIRVHCTMYIVHWMQKFNALNKNLYVMPGLFNTLDFIFIVREFFHIQPFMYVIYINSSLFPLTYFLYSGYVFDLLIDRSIDRIYFIIKTSSRKMLSVCVYAHHISIWSIWFITKFVAHFTC